MYDAIYDVLAMWREGWVGKLLVALIVALLVALPLAVYEAYQAEKRWQAFSDEHDCKMVGHVTGDVLPGVGLGVGANGQVGTVMTVVATPSKTGWLCDDGVTYWR